MKQKIALLIFPLFLFSALLIYAASTVQASSGGKFQASGAYGYDCSNCHSGGDAPQVMLTGPAELTPGQAASYTLTVQSMNVAAQTHAGYNLTVVDSADNPVGTVVLASADSKTDATNVEATHAMPKANDASGAAHFQFEWIAPTETGTYTLYYVGNSVDLSSNFLGDGVMAGTSEITVVAPSAVTMNSAFTQHNALPFTLIVFATLFATALSFNSLKPQKA